ncbi:MAG: VTT domain-containing protein [Candidatus Aenigmatarchaeota archaeon]|nr:VTT domain-containing protein [Candidatus Aenigmarchaeota archaeon]
MVLQTFLDLVEQGSYFAVFLASFVSSASILVPILPIPTYLPVIVGVGIGLNPFIVGILGGIGSTLGELFGYFTGLGGSAAIEKFEKRTPKFLKKFEKFYSKIGFWIVLVFAFIPFPFDIIGVLSGASKYDFRKFLLALSIGRTLRTLVIAYGGFYIIPLTSNLFS